MRALPLCLVLALPAFACGSTSHNPGFAEGDGGSSGSSGGTSSSSGGSGGSGSGSGGTLLGDGGAGGDAASNGCSGEATDYVYILSAENNLYRFAPNLKQFTLIGALGCQTQLSPNSMAVDRNANAYVNYTGYTGSNPTSGVIYKVSTQDASCGASPIMNLPSGWNELGMGYSTAGTNSAVDTLYVSSNDSGQLGLLDFGQQTVGPIGAFTGTLMGHSCELTGTGDGRLFGYFTTTPVYVAQVDKTNGSTPSPVPMTGVPTPQDYAFSFWGGHFYLYSSQGMGSSVADYDPTSGVIDANYIPNVGFDIVGAGVSTCAPLTMPQ
jgi:hypothetical protein